MSTNPRDLLELLLNGDALSSAWLEMFIAERVPEGLQLEYKQGLLGDKFDAPAVLREYVAGFANSEGGVLFLGIGEELQEGRKLPSIVTGCSVQGKASLHDWATSCIAQLAPHLVPSPRLTVIDVSDRQVLAVAVPRSRGLVPVVAKSEVRYHLRIGDSTVRAPDYLLSDLLLGRRQHPRIEVEGVAVVQPPPGVQGVKPYPTTLSVTLVNDGLIWVDECMVGVVCWAPARLPQLGVVPPMNPTPASRQLLSHLDLSMPSFDGSQLVLAHVRNDAKGAEVPYRLQMAVAGSERMPETYQMRPFSKLSLNFSGVYLPPEATYSTCRLALYVLPKGSFTSVFQLDLSRRDSRWAADASPTANGRAEVSWGPGQ